MRSGTITAVRWAWVVLVLGAAAIVLVRTGDDFARALANMSPWLLLASLAATLLAKLFLGENARLAAMRSDIDVSYASALRLYNLSQLGKYLPGSIWQFVSRAAAYRFRGAEYGQIRDALLVENLWVIAGASVVGAVLLGPGIRRVVLGSVGSWLLIWFGLLLTVALVFAAALAIAKRQLVLGTCRAARPSARVILVQLAIWGLLGIAFWALARGLGVDIGPLFATGLFSTAYVVGFLVPFAPAGLGVRDAALTVGLLPYSGPAEAVAVAVLARVVYLAAELLLVGVHEGAATFRTPSGETRQER